jgi:isoamylase
MILMGGEVRRTQGGNNNAYCQDNEISWFDWSLLAKHADLHRFVKLLTRRRVLRNLDRDHPGATLTELLETGRHAWHGVKVGEPDWGWWSHSVALDSELPLEGWRFHIILNAYDQPLDFELPPLQDGKDSWRRWIDTALNFPNDIVEWQSAVPFSTRSYHAEPRSVVVLISGLGKATERTMTAERL